MAACTDLYDLLADLLVACENAVKDTPGGPIGRVYVSPGPPPWDCEQLTVHAGGPGLGDTAPLQPPMQPAHRISGKQAVPLLQATVTVLRCVPVIGGEGQSLAFPSPTAISTAALATTSDCWAIWNHLATLKRAGLLFPPKDAEMFFDPAVSLKTQGGFAGWQLQFRILLGGYRTAVDSGDPA